MNILASYAMCLDDECPSKKACKRNAASGTVPGEDVQLYKVFKRGSGKTLFNSLENKCDNFIEIIQGDFLPQGTSMLITTALMNKIMAGQNPTEEDLKQCVVISG